MKSFRLQVGVPFYQIYHALAFSIRIPGLGQSLSLTVNRNWPTAPKCVDLSSVCFEFRSGGSREVRTVFLV